MTRPQPVSSRIGVTSSDSTISTRPIMPVVRIRKFTLLTPSCPCHASHASSAAGTSALINTSRRTNGVSTNGVSWTRPLMADSEVGIEIQAGVEARDLVGVAVEHQRLAAPGLADALLRRLAP